MGRLLLTLLAAMLLCGIGFAQSGSDQAPSGTVVDKTHGNSTEVQPAPEKIKVDSKVIRAAQTKLNQDGYSAGTPDGKMGPKTRAALKKYQADNQLEETGTLDEKTMTHLNVGAGKTMASAPGDIGRGAKAAGHDVVHGHPLAAAKAVGKGFGRAGKAVGEGTKSGVVGTTDKVTEKKKDDSAQPK